MKLEKSFEEKVYAGVLGKIIGVYLGRPFEGWEHERILKELGQIDYYVHDKLNKPLCVTDDDITGTFAFLRALKDFNFDKNISAKQIGLTWLNNLIENRTVLWWGGKGHSTEDTAYQNLKQGIHAPESGSIKVNGKVISEQIGAQIFIDGWALVSPGDPEQAVSLAGRAASVSHDGEAIYGAQIIAAIEAMAFVENDMKLIIEKSKKFIPENSVIYKLISDLQNWSSGNMDWKQARQKIEEKYGYDKYLGNCHIVPNHALVIMSLLFGDDNFQKSLMIVNTSGWDTDCNSGNVGCILGIKNGLQGLKDGPDYLSPINDIIYCPTAVGGETITDALTETYKIINSARQIQKLEKKIIKNNARYHFEMPGSTQGWKVSPSNKKTNISNIEFKTDSGNFGLGIKFSNLAKGENSECIVDTFFPEHLIKLDKEARETFFHYDLIATPIIYSGQKIKAQIFSEVDKNINIKLFVKYWGPDDKLIKISSEFFNFKQNDMHLIEWEVPNTFSNPIGQLGISIFVNEKCSGLLKLNYLDISGEPDIVLTQPDHITNLKKQANKKHQEKFYGEMWKNAWVKALDKWEDRKKIFRLSNNIGCGILFTGTDTWKNYSVTSNITLQSVNSGGLIVRTQGLKRYYTFELCSKNRVRIGKMFYDFKTIKEVDFKVDFFKEYQMSLKIKNNKLSGYINGTLILECEDDKNVLNTGGAGFIVSDGTIFADKVYIN